MLAWGVASLRDLPWRRTRDPWSILVSETMLQQTQVARVIDRLPRFLERFPSPEACAAAPAGDVVDEWAGLGYNRRPLNLHRAATVMVESHGGRVPERLEDLLALPGVGPYTARAVRAFAHELPAAVVDTNIGRVLARWDGIRLTPNRVQQRGCARTGRSAVAVEPVAHGVGRLGVHEAFAVVWGVSRAHLVQVAGPGRRPGRGFRCGIDTASPIRGSDRQLRGRLVDALRAGPVARSTVASCIAEPDQERAERIVAGLVRDGLAVEEDETLRLP